MKSFGGSGGGENKWLVFPVVIGTNGGQPPSKEENKLSKSSMSLEMLDGGCLMLAMSALSDWISSFMLSISLVHLQPIDNKHEK